MGVLLLLAAAASTSYFERQQPRQQLPDDTLKCKTSHEGRCTGKLYLVVLLIA